MLVGRNNRRLWSLALVSLGAVSCAKSATQPEANALARSCQVVLAADAGGDADILKLQGDLREPRSATRSAEQLGYRFIARSRVSNDPGDYVIAEQAAACLEALQGDQSTALLLRGHVLHQMHRFGEAEDIARRLTARREFVLDYGLLGDALMEQGRTREAGEAYQKMIDLKPFYQSYTRAAHLRWLKGDLDGAVQLMDRAVKAASPRDRESVAWAYTRLAVYELQRGRLTDARRLSDAALQFVSGYAAALLVQGRILLAAAQPDEAAAVLERAASLNPLPEYQWTLADALRASGQRDRATAVESQLRHDGERHDPRTLALFLSTRGDDPARAVELARREIDRRSDVFTLDALAWALASAGAIDEAATVMTRALAEGTEDGRLFVHAAAIAAAQGRAADAARWARRARVLRFTLLPSELELLEKEIVHPPA